MLLRKSSPHETDHVLRSRFKRQGYLYFSGIVDADKISRARDIGLQICRSRGWISRKAARTSAIFDRRRRILCERGRHFDNPEMAESIKVWSDSEAYYAIYRDPVLLRLVRRIMGGPIVRHPSRDARWARFGFPESVRMPTPIHQDIAYVKEPKNACTIWIPLSDCPIELGGLALWPGSHTRGLIPHSGLRGIPARKLKNKQWYTSNYQAGDFIIFDSHLVHKALPNRTPKTIRLSLDFRYCPRSSR